MELTQGTLLVYTSLYNAPVSEQLFQNMSFGIFLLDFLRLVVLNFINL